MPEVIPIECIHPQQGQTTTPGTLFPGARFSKVPRTFRARKASCQSACSEKLIFLHVFNIRKTKKIAKFEGFEPQRCEDIKAIVAPEIGSKSFGTFEKTGSALFEQCVGSSLSRRIVINKELRDGAYGLSSLSKKTRESNHLLM